MSTVTAQQILRSMKDLESWTEKMPTGDEEFKEYWKYYNDLIPFLRQFSSEVDNEEITRLIGKLRSEHVKAVEEGLRRSRSSGGFFSFFLGSSDDDDHLGDRGRALTQALMDIKSTLGNLIYQLKLYCDY